MESDTVYICGTIHYRNELVLRLSNRYRIIGYLEFREFYNKCTLDYKPVIEYTRIHEIKCDYFVIAYSDKKLIENAKKKLLAAGINESVIVIYDHFASTIQLNTLLRFTEEGENFENIIFGLSHAKSDIVISDFLPKTFSFAGPSMDLFCHSESLKYIINNIQ